MKFGFSLSSRNSPPSVIEIWLPWRITIVPDFKIKLDYVVKKKGKIGPKKVAYYLAELMNPKENHVKLSDEHQDFKWLPLKETCELSGFKDLNEAFEKSQAKIESL